MSKFKVGDLVKLVGDEYPGTGLDLNTVHPIHAVSGGQGYYILATTEKHKGDDFYFIEDELEAAPEAPKVPKFYVMDVIYSEGFDTQEAAEARARELAEAHEGDTYTILQPTKAFQVITTAQEVPVA